MLVTKKLNVSRSVTTAVTVLKMVRDTVCSKASAGKIAVEVMTAPDKSDVVVTIWV